MHIGAGGGYYTTILTELIGVTGRVTGIEFDAELAARAMANFAHWPHVRALHGDGTRVTFEPKAEIPASFIRHIDHQKRWIAERQDDLRQILDHLEVVISSADHGVGYCIKQSQASAKRLNKAGCRALTPDGPVLCLEIFNSIL